MNKKEIEERIKTARQISKDVTQVGLDNWVANINAGETLGKTDDNTQYSIEKYITSIQNKTAT